MSKYSMGMRQRLGVAACLLGDPQLLILDEPMNGLDPAGMLEMREMIQSLVAEGRTVVLSSHLLDEVERTCDAVAIVDHGKVIRQGPIADLLAGSAFELQIDCSDTRPGRCTSRGHAVGGQRRRRPRRRAGPLGRRNRSGNRGRDQPASRRGRRLRLPTPGGPCLSRVLVPRGNHPIGGTANDHLDRDRRPGSEPRLIDVRLGGSRPPRGLDPERRP